MACTGYIEIPGVDGYIKAEIDDPDKPDWTAAAHFAPETAPLPADSTTVTLHGGNTLRGAHSSDCGREGFTARAVCVQDDDDDPYLMFYGSSPFTRPEGAASNWQFPHAH